MTGVTRGDGTEGEDEGKAEGGDEGGEEEGEEGGEEGGGEEFLAHGRADMPIKRSLRT